MSCGLFGARQDRRGLARLSTILHACLQPTKTLVVDLTAERPSYGPLTGPALGEVVTHADVMARVDWSEWLDGLDVVLALETSYTPRIFAQAQARGVRTVLLAMPEYLNAERLANVDVLALPTAWRADEHPGAVILPVPVEPFAAQSLGRSGRDMWHDVVIHPAGSPAKHDRNGTEVVLDASVAIDAPVVVRSQVEISRPHGRAGVVVADEADPRTVFDGARLVVLPRRYGGLSLVALDAMAAGLPLLVTDRDPYADAVGAEGVLLSSSRTVNVWGRGSVIHDVDPTVLADAVNDVLADPGRLHRLAGRSRQFAAAHAWEAVRPAWDAALGISPCKAQEPVQGPITAPEAQSAALGGFLRPDAILGA